MPPERPELMPLDLPIDERPALGDEDFPVPRAIPLVLPFVAAPREGVFFLTPLFFDVLRLFCTWLFFELFFGRF